MNCSNECHCINNSQCNKESGNCGSSGCAPGWTGHNCSEGKNSNLFILCQLNADKTKAVYNLKRVGMCFCDSNTDFFA